MAMPMYMRIQQYIRDQIESGKWESETLIPTEFELMEQFGVSRITVTTALRQLVNEGIIYRVQGKGTFVSNKKSTANIFDMANLLRDASSLDSTNYPEAAHECQSFQLCSPGEDVAAILNLKKNQKVYEIIRTKKGDSINITAERLYLPRHVYMGFPEESLQKEHMSAIIKACGITIGKRIVSTEAVVCEAELCRLIGLSEGSPVIKISLEIYDSKEQPIALVEIFGAGKQRTVVLN